jgi:hypothetical protein
MSQENVDFVAGIFSVGQGMDKEAVLAAFPSWCSSCAIRISNGSRTRSAYSRTYRGHKG